MQEEMREGAGGAGLVQRERLVRGAGLVTRWLVGEAGLGGGQGW